jgi:hypothetical protein
VDDPNSVYFLLNVESRERAETFTNSQKSTQIGQRAGVLDGWMKYVEDV